MCVREREREREQKRECDRVIERENSVRVPPRKSITGIKTITCVDNSLRQCGVPPGVCAHAS